tara:strand:- start:312 stop:557 length:246 start_codon:yes stop_codon:yes gene_type:complete
MQESKIITGETNINNYRMIALLKGLKLELLGIKVSRGVSCYAILKSEFKLKGSRQKVYDHLNAIYKDWIEENKENIEGNRI